MSDQNQPTDPSQNPVPGGTRPVLTTEEIGTPTQEPQVPNNNPPAPAIPTDDSGVTLPPLSPKDATDTVIPPGPQTTTPSFDMPTVVGAPPKKKFGGRKVISTILGILLLVGGVGVGVTLVKREQDIRSQARECVDESCAITTKTTPNGSTVYWYDSEKADSAKTDTKSILKQIPELNTKTNDGKKSASVIIKTPTETTTETTTGGQTTTGGTTSTTGGIGEQCLKGGTGPDTRDATFNGQCKVAKCPNGDTNGNGACDLGDSGFSYGGSVDCSTGTNSLGGVCGQIDPIGNDGTYCKTASNQGHYGKVLTNCGGSGTGTSTTTTRPTATSSSAPSTAQCLNIKAYDTAFNLLTVDNLKTLEAGDIFRFAVSGNAASGSFDKARFKINSGSFLPETTAKKPGTQEFYYEYTIPDGVTSFNITAQIHHSTLGWSN